MRARHGLPRSPGVARFESAMPWLLVLVGVAVMVGYLLYALPLRADDPSAVVAGDAGRASPQPPPLAATATTVGAGGDATAEVAPPPVPRADPARRSPRPSPSPSPSPAPPPPALTAEYQLVDSDGDAFIGRIEIVNDSDGDRDWTLELAFPPPVGELNAVWTDGTRGPEVDRDGDRYVFSSAEPLAAGAALALFVHFDRDGPDVDPSLCQVDGTACTIDT